MTKKEIINLNNEGIQYYMKTTTQKIVILSLTSIAIINQLVILAIVLYTQDASTEVIALFMNIVSAVVGALGGLFVGKQMSTDENDETIELGGVLN